MGQQLAALLEETAVRRLTVVQTAHDRVGTTMDGRKYWGRR